MINLEYSQYIFQTILGLVLKIVLNNLSTLIFNNTSSFLSDKLSQSDYFNYYIKKKKFEEKFVANFNLETKQNIIPNQYTKIYKYFKKKQIIKDFVYGDKKINMVINDCEVLVCKELFFKVTNTIYNDKDLQSEIEIYTYSNNLDIKKIYKKLDLM